MSQADQTPGRQPRRPSLPAPASTPTTYGRPVYGRRQKPAKSSVIVVVTLRQDAAAAVLDLVTRHGLSRSGAAHHLIRLGAGLSPLPPLD
jgi:hypothetical protein